MRQQQFQRQMQDSDGGELFGKKVTNPFKVKGELLNIDDEKKRFRDNLMKVVTAPATGVACFFIPNPLVPDTDDWGKIYKEFSDAIKGNDFGVVREKSKEYIKYLDDLKQHGLIDNTKYKETVDFAKNDFDNFLNHKKKEKELDADGDGILDKNEKVGYKYIPNLKEEHKPQNTR
jgi:hypothetical protein